MAMDGSMMTLVHGLTSLNVMLLSSMSESPGLSGVSGSLEARKRRR